jgi:hypothetical protein
VQPAQEPLEQQAFKEVLELLDQLALQVWAPLVQLAFKDQQESLVRPEYKGLLE